MHLVDFVEDDEKSELLVRTEQEWNDFVGSLQLGDRLQGRVIASRNYGVFIDFGEEFPALIEVPNLERGRYPIDLSTLPSIDEVVHFQVIQFVPERRMVRAIELGENN